MILKQFYNLETCKIFYNAFDHFHRISSFSKSFLKVVKEVFILFLNTFNGALLLSVPDGIANYEVPCSNTK